MEKQVWDYFDRINKASSKCRECKKTIKCEGGSTSGMHAHLKLVHHIQTKKRKIVDDSPEPVVSKSAAVASTSGLKKYFQSNNESMLKETIARMVAKDRFSFRSFCSSEDLRMLLQNKFNVKIPTSVFTISTWVIAYSDQVRQKTIHTIARLKQSGKRFSLTFDEWTSLKNRRYMNINLHYHDKSNLFF